MTMFHEPPSPQGIGIPCLARCFTRADLVISWAGLPRGTVVRALRRVISQAPDRVWGRFAPTRRRQG